MVFDRIEITSPDEGSGENMVGGVVIPGNAMMLNAYAEVDVLGCGPDVKTVKVGQRLLVVRPQCNKVSHDGNDYWWTTEVAVMGIIDTKPTLKVSDIEKRD